MPSVDVAMARSLRGGVWTTLKESVVHNIARDLAERDIVGDTEKHITDVKTAFSSWDNCMNAVFCKWPVIAVMVIGGLIIAAILWCIIRCACCAKSCCCSCFSCFKCCGNCCGCCDPPGGRPHKYLDDQYMPGQGYRTEAPMAFPHTASRAAEPPQYAEFEVGKKGGEDALPAMPSWEGAGSKKVGLEEDDAVELEHLKKSPTSATEPHMPLIGGPSSNPASPMPAELPSPGLYGHQQGHPQGHFQGGLNGYGAHRGPVDPYSPQDQGYSYNSNVGNNRESVGFGLDQPYDTVPAVTPASVLAATPGRQSPAPSHNNFGRNHMDQPYSQPTSPDERGYDSYGQGNGRGPPQGQSRGMPQGYPQRPPLGPQGYGMRRQGTGDSTSARSARGSPAPGSDPRMRNSPGPRRTPGPRGDPYGQSPRGSPAPQNDYGRGQQGFRPPPPRDNYNGRSYSPAPERQFPSEPAQHRGQQGPPQRNPDSPITNNSGFDFTSGFARPQQLDHRPSESHEPPAQEAYPGYKPYQPAQEGWSGI